MGHLALAALAFALTAAFFAAGSEENDLALLAALVASALFPVALVAAGASRRERGWRLWTVLVVLSVLLTGSLGALWWLRGLADPPRFAGLPLPLAVLVFGVFLLPQLLVGLGYAWTFRPEERAEQEGAGGADDAGDADEDGGREDDDPDDGDPDGDSGEIAR